MKKLIAIMLLVSFVALTAIGCAGSNKTDAPTPMPSDVTGEASPSIPATDAPTDTPNPTPTEDPFPYDGKEYDTLLAFFELADENGVKNGEKCFKDYDPNRTDFWGILPAGQTEPSDDNEPWIYWDKKGHVTDISTRIRQDAKPLKGELNLNGFDKLKTLDMYGFDLEAARIENCKSLYNCVEIQCTGEAYLIGDYIDDFRIASDKHAHYESTGKGPYDPEKHRFTADLTADGSGRVGVYGYLDEHRYMAFIYAEPSEGHRFLGWYDESGKLISTETNFEILSEKSGGCVGNFTYIARFE